MEMKTREYRVWSKEEENALKEGVKKHGEGKWEQLKRDMEFEEKLRYGLVEASG